MQLKIFHIRLSREHIQADQEKVNQFLTSINVKKTAIELIEGKEMHYWSLVVFYEIKPATEEPEDGVSASGKIYYPQDAPLNDAERERYLALKEWAESKAIKLNVMSFMVCTKSELVTLAKAPVNSVEELFKIKGFGTQKVAKYGEEIVAILNAF